MRRLIRGGELLGRKETRRESSDAGKRGFPYKPEPLWLAMMYSLAALHSYRSPTCISGNLAKAPSEDEATPGIAVDMSIFCLSVSILEQLLH